MQKMLMPSTVTRFWRWRIEASVAPGFARLLALSLERAARERELSSSKSTIADGPTASCELQRARRLCSDVGLEIEDLQSESYGS